MENAHRPAALFFGVGGADHGGAAGNKPGFAQANKEAGNQDPRKIFSQPRGECRDAPENSHEPDRLSPAPAVDQIGDGKGKERHAENQYGGGQAALGVRQSQINLHRLENDGKDLPVHVIDDVQECAHDQDIMSAPAARL